MIAATKLRTAWSIGLKNIAAVTIYRLLLKMGLHPVQRISAELVAQPFFGEPVAGSTDSAASRNLGDTSLIFGWMQRIGGGVPNWHANAVTGIVPKSTLAPWWTLADFDHDVGDIKCIWDLSRFQWIFGFCAAAIRGDAGALEELNAWLADWCHNNPPYLGRNWKCGQETSLRIMHMAVAALLLGQERTPSAPLMAFVDAHLKRIVPTLAYARAQNNNHGTSEAAAIFIGASWLQTIQQSSANARLVALGRKQLEERTLSLVGDDGSFSQYSTVYHRMLLDTLSICEIWRRTTKAPEFSDQFYEKARTASRWLATMVEPSNGFVPNMGANDGTRLLPVTQTDYRDFRPSVALATALFCDERLDVSEGGILDLFRLAPRTAARLPKVAIFDKGGFAVIRRESATLVLRYPRFRFRPSQCDALHVDLWLRGENWLRDGGTFTYAGDAPVLDYFGGVRSHNTVQFDQRDQMPRLGRFLFGDWLQVESKPEVASNGEEISFSVSYRNRVGARHSRKILFSPTRLRVEDDVSGFRKTATLRWRLKPVSWERVGDKFQSGGFAMSVTGDAPLSTTMADGEESLYYFQKSRIPVIEATVAESATIITEFVWPR